MRVTGVIIFSLLGHFNALETQSTPIVPKSTVDYYWRDYYGLMPSGGIVAGKDENCTNIYLAQFTTAVNNIVHTIPAIIKPGDKHAIAAFAGRTITSDDSSNLKLLMYGGPYSNSAQYYQWAPPNTAYSDNCRVVIGGYEGGIPMYFGRAIVGNETFVGKVYSDESTPYLISPFKGGEIVHENYSVLAYCK